MLMSRAVRDVRTLKYAWAVKQRSNDKTTALVWVRSAGMGWYGLVWVGSAGMGYIGCGGGGVRKHRRTEYMNDPCTNLRLGPGIWNVVCRIKAAKLKFFALTRL